MVVEEARKLICKLKGQMGVFALEAASDRPASIKWALGRLSFLAGPEESVPWAQEPGFIFCMFVFLEHSKHSNTCVEGNECMNG